MPTIVRTGTALGYASRATALLSDASVAVLVIERTLGTNNAFIYHSSNRTSWTLKVTIANPDGTTIEHGSMVLDSSNNLHVCLRLGNGNIRYYRYTFAGGPTWTLAVNELVANVNGVTGGRHIGIEWLTGTVVMVAVTIGVSNTFTQNVRYWTRRSSDNTWVLTEDRPTWWFQWGVGPRTDVPLSIARDAGGPSGGSIWVALIGCTPSAGNDLLYMTQINTTTGAKTSSKQLDSSMGGGFWERVYQIFSTGPNEWTAGVILGGTGIHACVSRFNKDGYIMSWQCIRIGYQDYRPGELPFNEMPSTISCVGQPAAGLSYTPNTLAFFFPSGYQSVFGVLAKMDVDTSGALLARWSGWRVWGLGTIAFFRRALGGNNSNLHLKKLDILLRGSNSIIYHEHNLTPTPPISFTPADNSVINTDVPILSAVMNDQTPNDQTRFKARWQLAMDAGFATGVRQIDEPNIDLRNVDNRDTVAFEQIPPGALELSQRTWFIRTATVDDFDVASPWSAANDFVVSHPPNAINLMPANDLTLEWRTAGVAFAWKFTDTSPTDTQTAWQIIVESNETSSLVADSGKVVSFAEVGSVVIPPAHKDAQLRWKIRLWDSDDVVGEYSNYALFRTSDLPVATIVSPTVGEVVGSPAPTALWAFSTAFIPNDLPTLRYFWEAETISGVADNAAVSAWLDTELGVSLAQATGGNQPTLQTGEINGYPVVRFDGTDDWLRATLATALTDTSLGVFIVGRKRNATDAVNDCLASVYLDSLTADWDNLSSGEIAFADTTTTLGGYRNSLQLSKATFGIENYVISSVWDGSTHILYKNGTAQASVAQTGAFNANRLLLGAPWTASAVSTARAIAHDIAVVVVCSPAPTGTDRVRIENYLKTKYGIA